VFQPGYYGLSDGPDGCKPCNCSMGGSSDSFCDQTTGQCTCKEHMVGRTCDRPADEYFCPLLDHLVYEAEEARRLDQKTRFVERHIHDEKTWTGDGFVLMYEQSHLEFSIDGSRGLRPYRSGHYEIMLRHELPNGLGWTNVKVVIERESMPQSGLCKGAASETVLAHKIESGKLGGQINLI
jgi:hypothetical protein